MARFIKEYQIALDEMPSEFSTNIFIDVLRKLNVHRTVITGQQHVKFLENRCNRLTKRTFSKKSENTSSFTPTNDFKTENHSNEIESAIAILKNHGYKILKPITNYEEL